MKVCSSSMLMVVKARSGLPYLYKMLDYHSLMLFGALFVSGVSHTMIFTVLLFCIALASANAGHFGVGLVGPSEHGTVIQGPGSKASLVGPDGSHISAAVAGGTVVAPPKAGGVVSAAVSPGYVAAAIPAPVTFHSGVSIAGLGLVGAPGYFGIGVGSGHEGQYVPDYNEQLYDDGSYKGDYYGGHY